jgi:methyl-accepting chemotaxis protein
MEKLANVMTEMADRQASGAESALRDLVESFSEKLGDAGQRQADSMETSAEALSTAMGKLDTTIDTFLKKVADQINELNQVVTTNQEVNDEAQKRAEQFVANTQDSHEQFAEISTEVGQAAKALGTAIGNLEEVSKEFSKTVGTFSASQSRAVISLDSTTQSLGHSTKAMDNAGQRIENASSEISLVVDQLSETTSEAFTVLSSLPDRHQAGLKVFFDEFTQHLGNYTSSLSGQMEEFSEKLVGSSNHRIDEWTSRTQQFCNNMKDAVEFLNGTITEMSTLSSKKR